MLVATAVATAAVLTACSNVSTRTQTLGTTGGPIQLQDVQTRQLEIEPALKVDAPAEQQLTAPLSPAPAIEKPAAQAETVKAVSSSSAATTDSAASAKSSSYHDGYTCPGKGGSEARASSTDD
jgi:hypothetical protein